MLSKFVEGCQKYVTDLYPFIEYYSMKGYLNAFLLKYCGNYGWVVLEY